MNRSVFTRRHFLNMVGAAGGSPAVYQMAMALGLMTEAVAAPLALDSLKGEGRRVAILGAGIAGLTCAYQLERVGFTCTVLDASHRAGGRNLTIRRGDLVDEMGHPQICEFDEHPNLYFNAGPARIPAHHHLLHHYCRELEIPLEFFVNHNQHAWVQDPNAFSGKAVRYREYVTDARGFMSEIIAKAVNKRAFDLPFSDEDAERLLGFVRSYGELDDNLLYKGSGRAGYRSGGMISPPVMKDTLDFSEILKSHFWQFQMHFTEGEDQASPLMQMVGGMDKIIDAFVAKIQSPIHLQAQVTALNLTDSGVAVNYRHGGEVHHLQADYCLNSIPKHILTGIPNNFPMSYRKALGAIPRGKLFKLGVQMKERFWEKDDIYGGITWTAQEIEQLWYPPHGINGKKGVMLGAYTFNPNGAEFFARMTPDERLKVAIQQAEKIHPGYGKYVESAVSVPWQRMNHILGCTAEWTEALYQEHFSTLQQPTGRHYLVGDQVSYHPGWQEGALGSAHFALNHLAVRARQEGRG